MKTESNGTALATTIVYYKKTKTECLESNQRASVKTLLWNRKTQNVSKLLVFLQLQHKHIRKNRVIWKVLGNSIFEIKNVEKV